MSGTQDAMQQYRTSQIGQLMFLVLLLIVMSLNTVSSIELCTDGINFLLVLERLFQNEIGFSKMKLALSEFIWTADTDWPD